MHSTVSTLAPRQVPRTLLALLFALLVAACSSTPEVVDDPTGVTPQGDPAQAQAEVDGPMIAAYLPGSSALVVEVTSIESFATEIDLAALPGFPEAARRLGELSTKTYGHDVFDVNTLRTLGIDLTGPIGLAIVDPEDHEVAVLYARTTDEEVVMQAARDFAKARSAATRIESVAETGATIVALSGGSPLARGWVVLRDGLVMTIVTPAPDDQAWEHARFLAGANKTRSLATASSFTTSHAGLAGGRTPDVRIFYNLGAVAQRLVAVDQSTVEDDYATQQLREARMRGNRDDIQYWEEQVRQNAEWRRRREASERAWRQLVTRAIVPVTGVALNVDIDGGKLDVDGFAAVPDDDALPMQALRNVATPSPVVYAEATPPMFMMQFNAEHDELLELLEMILRLESPDGPAELRTAIKDNLGLDLDTDVLPLLDGELGGRIHIVRDDQGNFVHDESAIRFTVAAGVTDRAATVALVEKLFGHPMLVVLARRVTNADARWRVNVPFYTTVWVDVLDRHLVVSTTEDAASRIAGQTPLPTGQGSALEPTYPLLTRSDLAGLMAWDHTFVTGLFTMSSASYEDDYVDPHPGVAKSAASQAKEAELEALEAQFASDAEALRTEMREHNAALLEALGATAITGRVVEGGIEVAGRYALGGGSVTAAIGTVIEASQGREAAEMKLWDLQNSTHPKRYQLHEELRALRDRDAATGAP